MKKLSCILLIAHLSNIASAQSELNIMTFNIRLNLASDSLDAWPYRKDKLASTVLFYKADILGIQEALPMQMIDLQNALTGYSYVGVGRDDGKNDGEYSAIFYNKARLELQKTSTFWLSETPLIAGKKGWDAVCNRIVTWAEMKDKINGKTFFVFNTHFDHMGQIARRESAKLLLHAVDSIAGKMQAIVTGDFNSHPQDEPIQIITSANDKLHLTDTKAVSRTPHFGPTGTFNAFKTKEQSDQPIDYIFFNRGVEVLSHATISESWMGRFASDHFAVRAVVKLE
ncbi:MAG: endonuclease/exonuclease/phosphatase family protein [Ferruginibacter sp.]